MIRLKNNATIIDKHVRMWFVASLVNPVGLYKQNMKLTHSAIICRKEKKNFGFFSFPFKFLYCHSCPSLMRRNK